MSRFPRTEGMRVLPHADARGAGLSARERQLLRLLAEGRSEPEIALTLALDLAAVRNLAFGILRKLQVAARVQLRPRGEIPRGPQCV